MFNSYNETRNLMLLALAVFAAVTFAFMQEAKPSSSRVVGKTHGLHPRLMHKLSGLARHTGRTIRTTQSVQWRF